VTSVRLSVEPRFLGPMSVGTVEVIKLVSVHASVGLTEAKRLIDRCVFDGEPVVISMPSAEAAELFLRAVSALPGKPRINATKES
jgi:hypothetical protein